MDDPGHQQFVLCVDSESDMLGPEGEYRPEGEYPLFDGNQPSDFIQRTLEFCAALRQRGEATDAFVHALQAHDLLIAHDAKIDTGEGTQIQLSGFLIIDPKKFDAVPDNVFTEWRGKGWVGLIYAQLLSSHRWQNLVTLSKRPGRPDIVPAQRQTPQPPDVRRSDLTEEFRLIAGQLPCAPSNPREGAEDTDFIARS